MARRIVLRESQLKMSPTNTRRLAAWLKMPDASTAPFPAVMWFLCEEGVWQHESSGWGGMY